MHYVYFLLLINNDVYKGRTADLRERIKQHQNGKVKSTRNFRPLKLIAYEAYLLKSDAIRREKFLKSTEGRRLFKQQYRDILKSSSSHSTGRGVE